MAGKETAAAPGVKPTAEPGDEPATTTPDQPTQDANSAAVSAWRHPIEGPPPSDEPATPARRVPRRSGGG